MGLSIKVKIVMFISIVSFLVSIATALYITHAAKSPGGLSNITSITAGTVFFLLGIIALCLVSSIVFALTLIKPVDDLIIATQLIAEGKYDQDIEAKTADEVGRLVSAFNEMARKITRTSQQTSRLSEIASIEKQKTSLIIDAMADSVIVTDEEHKIAMFNPAAEKLFDIDKNKMRGRHIAHLLRRYRMDRLFSCFPEIDRENILPVKRTRIESAELAIEKPKKRIIKATVAPIKNERHIITGTVTVIEDVTKAKELDEIKNDFVSTVSHELRTPLTNIIGYTSLLLNDKFEKPNPQQRKALEVIWSESNVLHDLINDILDLSRLEAGKAKTKFEKVDLKSLIGGCNVLKLAQKKGIEVKMNIPESLPQITADRAKLAQVFTNLISNATKFTKEKGSISIRAYARKDHVQVDITDTGMGIRASQIPLIFNKFYQVQSHLTRTQTGTGLGLPIVKEIIGLHHALISVKSRLGKGTSISVALPKEQPPESDYEKMPYCWEQKKCRKIRCPAYQTDDKRCWLYVGTLCKRNSNEPELDKIEACINCSVYRKALMGTSAKNAKEDKKENNHNRG